MVLGLAVDSFLWGDSLDQSDSVSVFDEESLRDDDSDGSRNIPSNTAKRSPQYGRHKTFDSIVGVDDLSTEPESSVSSCDEVIEAVVPRRTEPTPSPGPQRKSSKHAVPKKTRTTKPRKNVEKCNDEEKHCIWIRHGRFWTIFGILCAWTAFAFSYQARNTPRFVRVEPPVYVDTNFEEVHEVGMVKFQLCINGTRMGMTGCTLTHLDVDTVDDKMFEVGRSMAFLAIFLGGISSVAITSAIFWSTINMVSVGFGFFVTYLFQSLTFLLFESNLCSSHKCHITHGSACSILSCVCWVLAGIASGRIDAAKYQRNMDDGLQPRKRRSRPPDPSELWRGVSNHTQATNATSAKTLSTSRDASSSGLPSSPRNTSNRHMRGSSGEWNDRRKASHVRKDLARKDVKSFEYPHATTHVDHLRQGVTTSRFDRDIIRVREKSLPRDARNKIVVDYRREKSRGPSPRTRGRSRHEDKRTYSSSKRQEHFQQTFEV